MRALTGLCVARSQHYRHVNEMGHCASTFRIMKQVCISFVFSRRIFWMIIILTPTDSTTCNDCVDWNPTHSHSSSKARCMRLWNCTMPDLGAGVVEACVLVKTLDLGVCRTRRTS